MSGKYTRWKLTPDFKVAKKDDPTWWTDSVRGHRSHCLIGINRTDVIRDGEHLGQEVHAVIGRLRIGIAMRFSHEALARARSRTA